MSNETKIMIMKTIAFIIFTAILCLTIFACKKDKNKEPEQVCREDKYSGTWEFTINKDKANEYKDTFTLSWNGSTYLINNVISTRLETGAYIRYQTDIKLVEIWKDNCQLKYNSSFDGRRL